MLNIKYVCIDLFNTLTYSFLLSDCLESITGFKSGLLNSDQV